MRGKVVSVLFVILMFGVGVFQWLMPDQAFSENENRYLAQMPDFSAKALADGSYTKKLGEYMTDQFPLRNQWVGLKTLTERFVGKRDSGGVYFGKDGYLIEMFSQIDADRYEKNWKTVKAFAEEGERVWGIRVQAMLVPAPSGILKDKLPANAPEVDETALLEQARAGGVPLFDVTDVLQAHSGESIYYKTDHHWTGLGAYYAYQAWQKSQGKETKPLSAYTEEVLSDRFYGTTYSKANLYTAEPDTIRAYYTKDQVEVFYNNGAETAQSAYTRSYLQGKDKYSVFFNGNQPVTKIKGRNPQGGKLLLVKDSYANTFAQFALEDYAEVHLIDLRYYKEPVGDYIKAQGISDVLILYSLKNFAGDTAVYALHAE
jgi:hypothetical protein